MKLAGGEYLVCLNNNTVSDPAWLEHLVAVAERHPKAGLVSGRIRLFYDQVTLTLQSRPADRGLPGTRPRLRMYGVETGLPGGIVQYLEGFSVWGRHPDQPPFRPVSAGAKIGLPAPADPGDWDATFILGADQEKREGILKKFGQNSPFASHIFLNWRSGLRKPENPYQRPPHRKEAGSLSNLYKSFGSTGPNSGLVFCFLPIPGNREIGQAFLRKRSPDNVMGQV